MVNGRPNLLSAKEQQQLKEELEWAILEQGNSAKEIADGLLFGVKGTIYANLKQWHVYYFAEKFGIKRLNEVKETQTIPPWQQHAE